MTALTPWIMNHHCPLWPNFKLLSGTGELIIMVSVFLCCVNLYSLLSFRTPPPNEALQRRGQLPSPDSHVQTDTTYLDM